LSMLMIERWLASGGRSEGDTSHWLKSTTVLYIVRSCPVAGAAGFKSGDAWRKRHTHTICVDEVKEGLNLMVSVEEMGVVELFP